MTHADFEHSPVTDEARCGFLPMLAVMLGFAFLFGNSLMFLFGAVAAMVYGQEDISYVLRLQGLLVPAIAVLGLNIWTTNDNAIYTAGLGLSNVTGFPKRYLVLVCGLLGTLSSIGLYARFCDWLNVLNVLIPPFGAIILMHLFLCRVGRSRTASPVAAIASWALGSFVALCGFGYLDGLLFLGCGIPALNGMVVAALAYFLLRNLKSVSRCNSN